jgi:tetratricopeptide (TPR) repeat protein
MTASRRPALHVRPLGILAAAVLLVGATWAGQLLSSRSGGQTLPAERPSTQTRPGTDAPIIDAPAAVDLAALDAQIETWSTKAAANDNDYISATNLGVLYLSRARLTGDLSDYERAGQAAKRALAADPGYTSARALDAVARFAVHDFSGALASAEALLADEPDQVDALTVVADSNVELGRLDAASAVYDRLAAIAPGPALDVRLARLAYLTGDRERSLELATSARDRAVRQSRAEAAFYHYQLGELARLQGEPGLAREAFAAALAVRPADRAALVGLARADAAEGRIDEAIAGLRAAAAIVPEPATLALLGDLLTLDGDAAGAEEQYATVRFTGELGQLAGAVYDRSLLQFELDHGGSSPALLERAEAAAETRADAGGLDVVAWASHRLGRDDEAWTAIERARETGIVDARILFHAGAIAVARGEMSEGRALLAQALDLGPALDPLERQEASSLLGR